MQKAYHEIEKGAFRSRAFLSGEVERFRFLAVKRSARIKGGGMASVLRNLGLTCLVSMFASACATITTGSSQTVNIMTEPEGAVCIFRREDAVIGVVNPTPGSLSVTKSHAAIEVDCRKEGFLDAVGTVGRQFQPMTFGNIILGGLIGVIVDAASGATAQYDATVSIRLTPAEFADAQARDNFFDLQRETLVTQSRLVKERIAGSCQTADCDAQLRLAEEQELRGLRRIEAMRKNARIKAP